MKHSLELSLLLGALALSAFGCKSDDDGDDGDQPVVIEGALGKANRPQADRNNKLDRAGRPAISAALISSFDPDNRQANLARYNAAGNADRTFVPIIAQSLAILDGLDRNCGNQLLADLDSDTDRYTPLATVLVDDQLYVRSDRVGSSPIYLGVEAEAVSDAQGSGGGRAPGDDVIERSYSVLAAGTLAGIDDGVPRDDATHDIDAFPFIAAPQ